MDKLTALNDLRQHAGPDKYKQMVTMAGGEEELWKLLQLMQQSSSSPVKPNASPWEPRPLNESFLPLEQPHHPKEDFSCVLGRVMLSLTFWGLILICGLLIYTADSTVERILLLAGMLTALYMWFRWYPGSRAKKNRTRHGNISDSRRTM